MSPRQAASESVSLVQVDTLAPSLCHQAVPGHSALPQGFPSGALDNPHPGGPSKQGAGQGGLGEPWAFPSCPLLRVSAVTLGGWWWAMGTGATYLWPAPCRGLGSPCPAGPLPCRWHSAWYSTRLTVCSGAPKLRVIARTVVLDPWAFRGISAVTRRS